MWLCDKNRTAIGPALATTVQLALALAMMMKVIDVVWSILVIIHVESALERYQLRRDFSSQTVPWKLD
jgi:hypothetical protein